MLPGMLVSRTYYMHLGFKGFLTKMSLSLTVQRGNSAWIGMTIYTCNGSPQQRLIFYGEHTPEGAIGISGTGSFLAPILIHLLYNTYAESPQT